MGHNDVAMATTERKPETRLTSTISGLPVDELYSPENVRIDYERALGNPGEYPFTRGVYETMYRGRLWTMRQFAGSAPPRRPTSGSATCSSTARPASRPRSTCRL